MHKQCTAVYRGFYRQATLPGFGLTSHTMRRKRFRLRAVAFLFRKPTHSGGFQRAEIPDTVSNRSVPTLMSS